MAGMYGRMCTAGCARWGVKGGVCTPRFVGRGV